MPPSTQNRRPVAALAPALLASLLVGCGVTDTERISDDATHYALVEFRVIDGVDPGGTSGNYRVGLLEHLGGNRRAYQIEEVGLCTDARCERLARRRGTGLVGSWGMLHQRGLTEGWAVGEPHIVEAGDRLSVYSTFAAYSELDIRAIDATHPVRIEATVVRRCPARVRSVWWRGFEWRSAGIVAIPRRVDANWVELKADCYRPGDAQTRVD